MTQESKDIRILEERLKKLAKEKSHLQLINHLMTQIGMVAGLVDTIETVLRNLYEIVGGTNLILYHYIDDDIFYTDVYGEKKKIQEIEDEEVLEALSKREFLEKKHGFEDTRMMTPEFTKASTWLFPLLVGNEIIGVLKLEGMQYSPAELKDQLPAFANYIALALKNEILGYSRLRKAYDELKREMIERKLAEDKIRIFQKFAESSGQGFGIASMDARIVYMNQPLCRLLDIDNAAEVYDDTFFQFYSKENQKKFKDEIIPAVKERGQWIGELGLISRKNKKTPTLENFFIIHNDQGEPQFLADVVTDISEQKKSETALLEAKKHLEDRVGERTIELDRANKALKKELARRKRTETALGKEKDFIDAALQAQMDTFFVFDPLTGQAVRWNRAFEEISGYSHAEVKKLKAPQSYYSESDLIKATKTIEQVMKTGSASVEISLITKDGNTIPTEYQVSSMLDEEGNIKYFISIGRDLRERLKSEVEYTRLMSILESSLNEIYIFSSSNLLFEYVNYGALKNLGFSLEEMKEMTPLDIKPEFDEPTFQRMVEPLLNNLEEKLVFQTVHKRKDGSLYPVEVHLQLVLYGTSRVFVAIIQDITERVKTEKALIERTIELNSYFTNALDLFCIADTDGHFRRLNEQWEHTLGYKLAELEESRFLDFVHPDDIESTREAVSQLDKGKDLIDFVNRYRCKDGSYRWLEWKANSIGKTIYAAARDITDRIIAEKQIYKLNRVYAVMSNINETIVRIHEIQKLFDESCRIAIEEGKFKMAWMGVSETNGTSIKILASNGDHSSSIDKIKNSFKTGRNIPVLIKQAIKTGQRTISNDIENDKQMKGFWEEAKTNEFRSCAFFPLKVFGEIIGLFSLYSGEPGFFDEDEIRLLDELAADISFALEFEKRDRERKQAEEELKESEEKYMDLYDHAPDMYVSVDARTAIIKQCNQTVADKLGYTKDEIIGYPIFKVYHPDCMKEVEFCFTQFQETGEVHDAELQLMRKDGSKIDVSLNVSATRDEDGTILYSRSTWRDITERKLSDRINAARLHLMQFAVNSTLYDLLEETLNKVEELTESKIGFYHFVENDQVSLTLQNWSSHTKEEACNAEGEGLHYDIDQAGVWVDCIHQRKPVIHNDYASLPHRKGMPEGHVEIIRELVVPVMRSDKIKAILGVGNKNSDYTEKDIETVSLLADLAWEIVERKIAEEALALRNRISEIFLTYSGDDMYGEMLTLVLEKTNSRYGVFGYIDENGALVAPSMTRDIWEQCHMQDKTIVFPRETWGGIWGKALVEKKSIYINETLPVPEGHIAITRALDVPILYQGEVIGNFLVGNKEEDYVERDRVILEIIAEHVAAVLSARLQKERQEQQRRLAEEERRKQEKLMLTIAENFPNSYILIIEKDYTIGFSSGQEFKKTGLDPESFLGLTIEEVFGEDVAVVKKHYQETFEGHETSFEIFINNQYQLYRTVPLYDEKGNVQRILAVVENITERKMAEEALYQQAMIDAALAATYKPLASVTSSIEIIIKTILDQALELTDSEHGYVSSIDPVTFENVGHTLTDMMGGQCKVLQEENQRIAFPRQSDGTYAGLWGYCLNTHKPFFTNSAMEHPASKGIPEGHIDLKSFLSVPVLLDKELVGQIAVGNSSREYTNQDLKAIVRLAEFYALALQRMRAEEQLIKAKEHAEESDRLKSAFLANMSHEVRTPMNAIIGFTDLLDEPGLSSEEALKFRRIIKDRSKDLLNIINDILDISKIEAGQMVLHEESSDLHVLFTELFDLYGLEQRNNDKSIEFRTKFDVPVNKRTVITDIDRLRQILGNLINNAFKFTEKGHIEVGCKFQDNNTLLFYVEDTGVGISKAKKEIVFERFRQAEDSYLTSTTGGTGLGLSISKGLVELLGGEIWVDSEENKGSTFYFTIPYKSTRPVRLKKQQAKSNKYQWSNKYLLIVEDDITNIEYFHEVFTNTDINLLIAEDGESAKRIIEENTSINLVLMDIRLPDINGFDLTRFVKSKFPDLPVIAQTAFASEEDKAKCFEAGCDDFISKPINITDLFNLLNKYL